MVKKLSKHCIGIIAQMLRTYISIRITTKVFNNTVITEDKDILNNVLIRDRCRFVSHLKWA